MKFKKQFTIPLTYFLTTCFIPQGVAQQVDSPATTVVTEATTEIAQPQASLAPFSARYIAYRNGSDIGHAVMSLEKTDAGYKLFLQK